MMYILYIYFNSFKHYLANTLALPHYFRKNKMLEIIDFCPLCGLDIEEDCECDG